MKIQNDQLDKLFDLAGVNKPQNINQDDVSKALVEIEKKLLTSSSIESELESESAPSILVVDDLELSIYQLSLLLTKSGYNINIARSTEEAIQQYKKQHYQYVLLDLFLPEPEDGLRVLDTINNDEKTKQDDTKVIVISGTDDKELINEVFKKGANEFIEKSPDWHKHILRHIRQLEILKQGRKSEISAEIIDEARKIVAIKASDINKESMVVELEKEFATQVNSGFINIIFDMQDISSIDSRGIGTLIYGYKICSENGGSFKLCNVKNAVNETLTYVFLHNIIQIFNDRKTAVESFK